MTESWEARERVVVAIQNVAHAEGKRQQARSHRQHVLPRPALLPAARHPEIVLVDEFAHSNSRGEVHEKRWEDNEQILDAGIDVTYVEIRHEGHKTPAPTQHCCSQKGRHPLLPVPSPHEPGQGRQHEVERELHAQRPQLGQTRREAIDHVDLRAREVAVNSPIEAVRSAIAAGITTRAGVVKATGLEIGTVHLVISHLLVTGEEGPHNGSAVASNGLLHDSVLGILN